VALDSSGNLYIADTGNNTIRMISTAGSVSTVAGQTGVQGITLGALPASLGAPTGVSVDAMDNLYVGSSGAILKIQFSH
jgi:sugar lactone lactonase YvrE